MKHYLFATLTLIAACFSIYSHASEINACVIEGTAVVDGQTIDIQDCVERTSSAMPEDKLKNMCEHFSRGAQALGQTAPKITYAKSCPSGAQGACTGMGGGLIAFKYYKRTNLAETKSSCQIMGGLWK